MIFSKPRLKIPKRKKSSHKGQNGVVLAVGGSVDYPGAAILASLAALRSGCDIVRLYAPEKVAWAANCYSPDVIAVKAKGNVLGENHFKEIKNYAEKSDVILFGNGVGLNLDTRELCRKICGIEKYKVIDADGIKSISMQGVKNSIITPHSKELEIFLSNSKIDKKTITKLSNEVDTNKKARLIEKITQKFLDRNNVILLKGQVDSIISKNKVYFVKGGNAGLTKGGTGDVLAGLCAGFLAQSGDLIQSAVNASTINKKIGDILLRKKKGFAYLASDMVWEIENLKVWH